MDDTKGGRRDEWTTPREDNAKERRAQRKPFVLRSGLTPKRARRAAKTLACRIVYRRWALLRGGRTGTGPGEQFAGNQDGSDDDYNGCDAEKEHGWAIHGASFHVGTG